MISDSSSSSCRILRQLDACASAPVAATLKTLPSDASPPSDVEPQSRQLHGLPSMLAGVAPRPQSDYRLAVHLQPATHRRDCALRPDLETDEPLRAVGITAVCLPGATRPFRALTSPF